MVAEQNTQQNTFLSGMKEITDYVRRSEASVLTLIRTQSFPATKVLGIWESNTAMIDQWREAQVIKALQRPKGQPVIVKQQQQPRVQRW